MKHRISREQYVWWRGFGAGWIAANLVSAAVLAVGIYLRVPA